MHVNDLDKVNKLVSLRGEVEVLLNHYDSQTLSLTTVNIFSGASTDGRINYLVGAEWLESMIRNRLLARVEEIEAELKKLGVEVS